MDVRMEGIDGLEATRRIRSAELERGQRVPIIAVSASVLDHEIEGVLAAGCDDFLPKPFRESTLFEKIGVLVGAKYVARPQPAKRTTPPASAASVLAALGELPPEIVGRLRSAVVAGDVEEARMVAAEIRTLDEALGVRLEEMIGRYRFDELDGLYPLA